MAEELARVETEAEGPRGIGKVLILNLETIKPQRHPYTIQG